MVGFFTGSAIIGILVSQFLAGRPTEKAIAKPDCFLLSAGRFRLRVVCLEPQLFHSAVCWGVPESSFGRPPTRRCSPLAREHADRTGREAVMFFDTARAGVACVGDWPPLAYALAMGFGFTVMYLSAAVAFVVWRNGMVLPAFHA